MSSSRGQGYPGTKLSWYHRSGKPRRAATAPAAAVPYAERWHTCVSFSLRIGMRVLRAISFLVVVLAVTVLIWRAATRAPDLSRARGVSSHAAPPTWTPITEQTLNHGRFKKLTVYSPHSTPRGFVLLLSG